MLSYVFWVCCSHFKNILRCTLLFGLRGHFGLLKGVNISFFLSIPPLFSQGVSWEGIIKTQCIWGETFDAWLSLNIVICFMMIHDMFAFALCKESFFCIIVLWSFNGTSWESVELGWLDLFPSLYLLLGTGSVMTLIVVGPFRDILRHRCGPSTLRWWGVAHCEWGLVYKGISKGWEKNLENTPHPC